jgi:UPF0755 protein
MKKRIIYIAASIILAISILAYLVFGGTTAFAEKTKYVIIPEDNTDKASVIELLKANEVLSGSITFSVFSSLTNTFKNVKPGKYEFKQGESVYSITRKIKNGRLAAVNLVINKLRIREDLAKLIAKNFSSDSATVMQFLNSNDSLKPFGVDTNTVFTMIIPDTYTFYWNTTIHNIFTKLQDASDNFWNKNDRINKANKLGLTPATAYTLASIVEEETNHNSDRAKIASVYLNRLQKQMPLQACPTIKYAMKNFTLTRIYEKYLFNPSPYNTYRVKGLTPGPICTPSPKCIDVILDAPTTDYLFFVAKANFDGFHHFSNNFAEHNAHAKEYQKALDAYTLKKQNKTP